MSWNYTLHQINRSFEQIAQWYREFMHRVETSFITLHERIEYLEQHPAGKGPSDEQVERILRKILAERFADTSIRVPSKPKDRDFLQKPSASTSIPNSIQISAATLQVDPDGVPSKAYKQAFQMLEGELSDFPRMESARPKEEDDSSIDKVDDKFKRPKP